jgi:rod shape-determining protein MreD
MATLAILAMHNNTVRSTLLGFLLGLAYDLTSTGPLGAMTLVLTLMGYGLSFLHRSTAGGGFLANAAILALALLLGEFLTSVLYAVTGSDSEFLLSLAVKVLPTMLYDLGVGLLLLALYSLLTKDRLGGGAGGGGSFAGTKLGVGRAPTGRPLKRRLLKP